MNKYYLRWFLLLFVFPLLLPHILMYIMEYQHVSLEAQITQQLHCAVEIT